MHKKVVSTIFPIVSLASRVHPDVDVGLQLLEGDLVAVLRRALLRVHVHGRASYIPPHYQHAQGQKHQVQTAEAVLEGHELEVGLLCGEVDLRHVHVGRVGEQEDAEEELPDDDDEVDVFFEDDEV